MKVERRFLVEEIERLSLPATAPASALHLGRDVQLAEAAALKLDAKTEQMNSASRSRCFASDPHGRKRLKSEARDQLCARVNSGPANCETFSVMFELAMR
jgi:hypothetical protein